MTDVQKEEKEEGMIVEVHERHRRRESRRRTHHRQDPYCYYCTRHRRELEEGVVRVLMKYGLLRNGRENKYIGRR